MIEYDLHPHILDASNFVVEHAPALTIRRNTEVHHAAGQWPSLIDLDPMPHASEMIGGRQPTETRANDKHVFTTGFGVPLDGPITVNGLVA